MFRWIRSRDQPLGGQNHLAPECVRLLGTASAKPPYPGAQSYTLHQSHCPLRSRRLATWRTRSEGSAVSLTPNCLQTSGIETPLASCASASRSLRMICSGVCRFRFISRESFLPPWGGSDSHYIWTQSTGSGQLSSVTLTGIRGIDSEAGRWPRERPYEREG